MDNEALTFGEALALVEAKISRHVDISPCLSTAEDKEKIDDMLLLYERTKEKYQMDSIPSGCCVSAHPFLHENDAFFISHLLLDNPLPENDEIKPFIKHLNDCYWCFRIYSKVFRDYYWKLQKIDNRLGGTNDNQS